jgi:hypothetical protein
MTFFKQIRGSAAVLVLMGIASAMAHAVPAAPRIGVQLWSVKDEVKQDFEGTLTQLARLGFQGVELPANSAVLRTTRQACAPFSTRPDCNARVPT